MRKYLIGFILSLTILTQSRGNVFAFDPNLILSDKLMEDYSSMTFEAIQNFLAKKSGFLSRFIDLDTDGIIKTAAEIIRRAAVEHKINPRVIIATLQKEQSLIEDPDPDARQLDWATGYAVCDSCSTNNPEIQKFKGFSKQVDSATWQFRQYVDDPSKYKIKPAEITKIDGEIVIPANKATASLYNYTPHFHGNENFSKIWQRYFGDPLEGAVLTQETASPSAVYAGQSTAIITLDEGESGSCEFRYKNIGTTTWAKEGAYRIMLAKASIKDHLSKIDSNSFSAASVEEVLTIPMEEASVSPGGIGTFIFQAEGRGDIDTVTESFVLVLDSRGWLPGTEASVIVVVRQAGYAASVKDISLPKMMKPGEDSEVVLKLANRGKWDWQRSTFSLEVSDAFRHPSLKGSLTMKEENVKTGEEATFAFKIRAPQKLGETPFSLKANLGAEAKTKITKELGNGAPLQVAGLPYNVNIIIDAPLKGKITLNTIPKAMKTTWRPQALFQIENIGTKDWKGFELRSTDLEGKKSPFYNNEWESSVIITKNDIVVPPGKGITVILPLSAPKKAGTYRWAISLNTSGERIYLDKESVHEQVTRIDK